MTSQQKNLDPEFKWRANTYSLLARLLSNPPDTDLLTILSGIGTFRTESEQTNLSSAWMSLSYSAQKGDAKFIGEEYQALFIGLVQGEVVPYGSWYLSGNLMEKPLALLRKDLAPLGISRQASVCEPEDHVAALCEVMRILIMASDSREQAFFKVHIGSWMETFFIDLGQAKSADFYRSVSELGKAFLKLENDLLDLC